VFDDGRLVIADFGLAIITRKTGSGSTKRPPQGPGEQGYRPPENSTQTDMGSEYDDWAMGCIILEILVFAAKGPEGVQQFRDARQTLQYRTDYFYYDVGGVRSLHPEVVKVMGALEVNTGFTAEVLLVVKAMLEIDPKQRICSNEASKSLRNSLARWRNQVSGGGSQTSSVETGPASPDHFPDEQR
jgi:serine/threonine protein kinase